VKTSGSLPNGEELDSVTVDPQEVTISGSKEDLADIDSIEIPSDVVNLSNITADWETTVDLSSYLPDGVLLVNSDDSKATVTVTLKEEGQKTFDVPTSNLTIQNLGSGLTGTFTSDTVSITISGPNTELSQLDASTLTGSVDASGLTDGKHVLAVTLSLSGNLQQTAASTELEIASSRSGSSTSSSSSSSSGSSSSSSGSSSSSKSSSSN
jgi:YbbR domain-containing protein